MDKTTKIQKLKIGLQLYNFLYSFTSEGYKTFDAKYPDYEAFKNHLDMHEEAPVRYMQKIMDGE